MYNWLSWQTPCPLPAGPPLIDCVVIWLGTLHIPTGDSVVYAIRQLQEIIVDIWCQESVLHHELTVRATHFRCTRWGWIINKCFTCKKLLQLLLRTLQRTVSVQYFGLGWLIVIVFEKKLLFTHSSYETKGDTSFPPYQRLHTSIIPLQHLFAFKFSGFSYHEWKTMKL